MRIVSLLPSATEMICGLGLRDALVGVSHECDFPVEVASLPKVTRKLIPDGATSGEIDLLVKERQKNRSALYSLDLPTLLSLSPECMVTQALCDVCAVAEDEVQAAAQQLAASSLNQLEPRIVNLDPACLDDIFTCIGELGKATLRVDEAQRFVESLKRRVQAVELRSRAIAHRPRVLLLEWIDPPFSAGHWNPELIEMAGGRGLLGAARERSARLDWQQVLDAAPDVLVIACCGFGLERSLKDLPILTSYPGWGTLPCVRNRRVYVVDGSAYFNRPGPRLIDSLEILANALHPTVHALPVGLPIARQVA